MNLLRDLFDFFLPRTCHICGCRLRDAEEFFCVRCVESLPRSLYHHSPMNPMERRFAGIVPFVRATGHFIYSRHSRLASAIHDMKYRRFPNVGRCLGEIVGSELLSAGFFDGADIIVPVPMHWFKQARRGYNQADFIAQGISAATRLPVSRSLRSCRAHKSQTSKTLAERQANLAGSFRVADPDALRGRGVVIVDDVCTTGATLRTLAEAVMAQVPDCRLYLLTLCVTI